MSLEPELFYTKKGTKLDASLHAPLLASKKGNRRADVVAVKQAIKLGVSKKAAHQAILRDDQPPSP